MIQKTIPLLYSYTIPYDDGAAPNPYWDILTLAICKPVIRRTAAIGDWVVGTGSKNSPIGNIQNFIVYIMEVTEIKTMHEYDEYCRRELPKKIPNLKSTDTRLHVGDCIYDYSNKSEVKLRPGVHNIGNQETDLGGKYVLLSNNFYYFGDHPLSLPKKYQRIIKPNQGHKSKSNSDISEEFIDWIKSINTRPNTLVGSPQMRIDFRNPNLYMIDRPKTDKRTDKLDEKECRKGIC